jgi:predicted ATPase
MIPIRMVVTSWLNPPSVIVQDLKRLKAGGATMGIQELEIRGFRSLRHVRWTPGRLNVLIGPNGSGKSNLLQALEFLNKVAENKLSEEVLRQGGIVPLLWDGKAQEICWQLKATLQNSALRHIESLYQLELRQLGSGSGFRVQRESLDVGTAVGTASDPPLERDLWLTRSSTKASFVDEARGAVVLPDTLINDEQSILVHTSLYAPLTAVLLDALKSWSFYHALRVDREAPVRQAAIARLEQRLAEDGQNLIPVLHTLYSGNREFKKALDAAMRAAFGNDYEEIVFPPAADQRVQLRLRWRSLSTEQSAANLSDGTLRFLMLVAILANPKPGDLIAIDEPETGLHPSMFPIIAELAAEAAERTQVIFTTHSPQFLDAFRGEAPTTTVAELVEGETRLSVLDGPDLQKWLARYSLGDLFVSGQLEALA